MEILTKLGGTGSLGLKKCVEDQEEEEELMSKDGSYTFLESTIKLTSLKSQVSILKFLSSLSTN